MDFLAVLEGIAARTGVEVPERDLAAIATLDGCTAYVAAQHGRRAELMAACRPRTRPRRLLHPLGIDGRHRRAHRRRLGDRRP